MELGFECCCLGSMLHPTLREGSWIPWRFPRNQQRPNEILMMTVPYQQLSVSRHALDTVGRAGCRQLHTCVRTRPAKVGCRQLHTQRPTSGRCGNTPTLGRRSAWGNPGRETARPPKRLDRQAPRNEDHKELDKHSRQNLGTGGLGFFGAGQPALTNTEAAKQRLWARDI